MKGEWARRVKDGGISVVFVRDILSSGEVCWPHSNGVYWSELLKNVQILNLWASMLDAVVKVRERRGERAGYRRLFGEEPGKLDIVNKNVQN